MKGAPVSAERYEWSHRFTWNQLGCVCMWGECWRGWVGGCVTSKKPLPSLCHESERVCVCVCESQLIWISTLRSRQTEKKPYCDWLMLCLFSTTLAMIFFFTSVGRNLLKGKMSYSPTANQHPTITRIILVFWKVIWNYMNCRHVW